MISVKETENLTVDHVDRRIIHALQIAPRAAFGRIAAAVEVSEPTVARRYHRLVRAGLVRVIGVVNPRPLGQATWMVRLRCKPHGTAALARSLAAREDVSWVTTSADGAEVTFAVRSLSAETREDLLIQRLPRSTPVLAIDAAVELHQYLGGAARYRSMFADALGGTAGARLRAEDAPDPAPPLHGGAVALEDHDRAIIAVLARDGRASYTDLAAAAGITEGRAARAFELLTQARVVAIDVDLAVAALGYTSRAGLWLSVAPSRLEAAGRAIAAMPEVTYVGAMSGRQNLFAAVMCRSLDELYLFLTQGIARIEGVQSSQLTPVVTSVKQSGSLMDEDRFAVESPRR
ncbi:AsnC family transcriptional regulator [Streptomyces sp. NPDC005722]